MRGGIPGLTEPGFDPRSHTDGAGNVFGTIDELKSIAQTPEDVQRIHVDADGRAYLPKFDWADEFKATLGMGFGDAVPQPMARAGTRESAKQSANLAKHGVVWGPYWGDVDNLNRGRRTTGAGPEFHPGADLAAAVPAAANMQQRINAGAVDQGMRAQAGQDASRDYTTFLAGKGLDTEKAAYELGPGWQGSSSGQLANYQWGEPQSAALGRRSTARARR